MIDVRLQIGKWCRVPTDDDGYIAVKGTIALGDTFVDLAGLSDLIPNTANLDELRMRMCRLNGFYALVRKTSHGVFAAVDHIRSRPLFYASVNGVFYLSDDAWWIQLQVGAEVDLVAKDEFLLTGYVTGRDTLNPYIKQLQAGEFLLATLSDGGVSIQTSSWYRFWHTEPEECNCESLGASLDLSLVNSIRRLIRYANGRQIVVPLSGGYDSRIIAILLRRLGYENVLTFSYGEPGNRESAYSQRVARVLGWDWCFAEYGTALWSGVWKTRERFDYQRYAFMLVSLPLFQDWLAIKILSQRGVLASDCILVPGHTGDFVAGGHTPLIAKRGKGASMNGAIMELHQRHYSLIINNNIINNRRSRWEVRILQRVGGDCVSDGVDLANVCDAWNWQERQAKFICNSVRVYEHFGYDWWLPLWDLEFTRFWQRVPLGLRIGRSWFKDYVAAEYARVGGAASDGNASDEKSRFAYLRGWIDRVPAIRGPMRMAYRFIRSSSAKPRAPVYGMEECLGGNNYATKVKRGYTYNSILADVTLADCLVGDKADEKSC